MHFGLTEEQNMLQETLRRLTEEELPPPRRRECFDAGSGFDATLWQRAAEVGVPGLIVPSELGGSDLEMLDLALAFEVLGEAAVPGPFLGHTLATLALTRGGSDAQKQKWLPLLASGERIGGCAFGEGGDLWGPDDWSLPLENGMATGSKRFAELCPDTDLFVVGLAGGRLGLVERSAPGLSVEAIDSVDRSRSLAHLHMENTPIEALDPGRELATDVMDGARILLAADAFGAAWKLIRTTIDYTQTREQFSTPIA